MNWVSMHLMPNDPVNSIRMVSRFASVPLFWVYAFFVDGLLIDAGFTHGLSKQNLINAFSKNPSSPQRIPAPPLPAGPAGSW